MSFAVGLVEQLHGLIDRLASVAPEDLSVDERAELAVRLQAECSRLGVVAADVLPAWVESGRWQAGGTLSPELALARDARRDRRRVRYELRRARLLDSARSVRAAVLDGRLSLDHVDLLVRAASKARFELFLKCESWLVDQCARCDLFDDAAKAVAYWIAWADDQVGVRREPADPSTLYLSRSETTGEAHLDGHFNAVDTEIVERELRRLEREILLEDRRNKIVRTRAQRRAAALVRMAARSVNAAGATARPLFEVVIGDQTARRLCELASGAVISPEDLQPFIDTAVMESFLFDGHHTILSTSTQRTFRGALRRAIKVRDRRCQHSSVCPRPASESDVDHRRPAARGGLTNQFNARIGCWPHNRRDELRDEVEPLPERDITTLDDVRAKLRWITLELDGHPDDQPAYGPWH